MLPSQSRIAAFGRVTPRLGRHGLEQFKRVFADPTDRQKARSDLARYLDDLTSLLLEVCRLGRLIEAPFATGMSDYERPSIQPDESNNLDFHDLSWLIEAIVRSFDAAATDDIDHATAVALRWRLLWHRHGHALLGRLYLHAAVVLPERLGADRVVDDLLASPDMLWSGEYRAEVLPVLRLRIAEASSERQQRLIHRLLEPPPSGLFRDDGDEPIERYRGQRLAWLQRGGLALEEKALALAASYLAENPPSTDPRADEVFYIRHTVRVGAIGFGPSLVGQPLALILENLRAEHDSNGWPISAWDRSKRVADWLREEPQRVVEALEAFVAETNLRQGALYGVFWALGALQPDQLRAEEIVTTIDLVLRHEERLIGANPTAVAGWLENIASWPAGRIDEERFFRLWECTFAQTPEGETPTNENADLDTAINALGGKLAEALRDRFWLTEPYVGQGLPEPFTSRLERLVHGETLASLHARLVYMQSLDPLFAVDPAWTREHLLPRLSWQGAFADQAAWHWRAHLLYGAWSLQLAEAYRADFLEALGRFADPDTVAFRLACGRFAVLGAIHGFFSRDETRRSFAAMGPQGGAIVIETLRWRLTESETPTDLWQTLIGPWLDDRWPPATRFSTDEVAEAVAEIVIEADDAFPEALAWAARRNLLRPLSSRYGVLATLTDEDLGGERHRTLPDRFPGELCRFLSQILGEQPLLAHERDQLRRIVEQIETGSRYHPAVAASCLARLRAL